VHRRHKEREEKEREEGGRGGERAPKLPSLFRYPWSRRAARNPIAPERDVVEDRKGGEKRGK